MPRLQPLTIHTLITDLRVITIPGKREFERRPVQLRLDLRPEHHVLTHLTRLQGYDSDDGAEVWMRNGKVLMVQFDPKP
jgi:hypothetical protein